MKVFLVSLSLIFLFLLCYAAFIEKDWMSQAAIALLVLAILAALTIHAIETILKGKK